MKNILRSFLVIAIAVLVTAGATTAYFTANITVTANQISTGTMIAYVGSYANPTGDNVGQWVGYADKLGNHQVGNFPAITNVQPGETRSGYVVVANAGTLPFQYQGAVTGAWTNGALSSSMMTVPNVHRYAANNCEADVFCEDIYFWLTGAGYTNVSGGSTNYASPSVIGAGTAEYQLAANQFTIYRVDVQLSTSAGNEYQGETFNYTLNLNTKQTNAPSF